MGKLSADTRILIYLRHAPTEIIGAAEEELHQENPAPDNGISDQNPGYWTRKELKGKLSSTLEPNLSGILATYAGYSDFSNTDGSLCFPLRHATPKLFIAVTREINLVPVKGNTITHGEFLDPAQEPLDLYQCEKKKDEKEVPYWQITKISPPADLAINPITVVVFTKPTNIVMPEGIFMTDSTRHLILPPLYLVGNASADTVMKMIDKLSFFEPIATSKQIGNPLSEQRIITNY